MKISFNCLIIALLFSITGLSQQTLLPVSNDYNLRQGMELFEKGEYNSAQQFFIKSFEFYKSANSSLEAVAEYYIALCAINMFNEDAEYLTFRFISDHPHHSLVNPAYFNLAGYFYARKKWPETIQYYEKVDKAKLSKEEMGEYYFKLGYAYFAREEYALAKPAFYQIKDIDTKYTSPALYYYSHIHYTEGDYQTALNGMLRLTKDKTFGPIAPYYIVQIYYRQSRYQDIIDFVPGIIDNVTDKRLTEVSRITAEAYAQLGKYNESLPYFQTFLDSSTVVTKEDKYQAGYAFYKSGKYPQAIVLFGAISNTESQLGQNASYYLADCYIKSNDKQKARLAFQSASSMEFDPVIRQDALFNYALITYELGNDPFNESVRAFQEFIKLYPESKRIDEVYKYLIQSFLNARNYGLALESLEKSNLKSDDLKRAYQRIAYYRGVELYNMLNYTSAIDHFDKSLKYSVYEATLKASALYWRGESYFKKGNYEMALQSYTDFKNAPVAFSVEGYKLIDYNLGYAYFKLKQYGKAIEALRKFASGNSNNKTELADALNRIGDCYYAQTNYTSAIEFYDRASKFEAIGADYALLQSGICQGLLNKDVQKISSLKELSTTYPNSSYSDVGLMEMSASYVKIQNTNEAILALKKLLADIPNSSLAPEATLQIGLLYYNMDKYDESINYFKQTVNKYPGTPAAKNALFGLKNIYVDLNKVDDYFAYVNSLGKSAPKVSISEQDSLSFASAEKIYSSGDCIASSSAMERYITNYPQGNFLLNAHYYKADCNYRQKEFDKASTSFNFILSQPANMYTERALLGSARIEMQKKNYERASQLYSNLAQNYATPANTKEAYTEIMRANYRENKYDESLVAARKVLSISKISPEITREATFIAGRSLQETGRNALAMDEYKKISNEVMSVEGAESKYHLAELYYKLGDLKQSEKEILDFSQKTTPHEYWIARSFILWSDIYVQNKDYFQANQTLQSIIDYYENSKDGIVEMAKEKKQDVVKLQEAKEQPSEKPAVEVKVE